MPSAWKWMVCVVCFLGTNGLAHKGPDEFINIQSQPSHKVVHIDWRAQLDTIKKQLAQKPDSSFLHGQAAIAYDALGNFPNFEREIEMAMKLAPHDAMPRYMAYAVYKRRHLEQKQATILQDALKIDPANPFGHYEEASMLENQNELSAALAEYHTTKELLHSLKSNPGNFKNGMWIYTDAHGNPYDVTGIVSHIESDIRRAQSTMQHPKGQKP